MTINLTPPNPELPTAALLCFCTYIDNPNRPSLDNPTQSNIQSVVKLFFPDFNVVWSCTETPDYNYAFIACSTDNKYFLAIRGSLPFEVDGQVVIDWGTIYNWFEEDFNVFAQQPWPYVASGTAYVADGANDAFCNLEQAVDVLGSTLGAYAFLKQNAVSKSYPVYITGHSLGGNMADTYASYFAQQLSSDGLSNAANFLFTFAAPAAGDQNFVSDLQAKFPPGRSYHYEIDNDIIPKFPVFACMYNNVANLYSPSPQAESIYFEFDGVDVYLSYLIEAMALAILVSPKNKAPYQQTPVSSAPYALSGDYTANTFADWFQEAAYQHSVLHYLFIFWGKGLDAKIAAATPRMSKSRSAFATPKFASAKVLRIGKEKPSG